ncbi:MAG: type II toxin-antitoxin system TacA family antitoxin [Candidatus Anammoxibacter sp.]
MKNQNLKTKTEQTKSANLNIRAKPGVRSLIGRAATITNKTVTDFVLEAACREAEEVLFDKRLFTLNEASYNEFVKALDAPIPSNKKLHNLLNRKPLWEQ